MLFSYIFSVTKNPKKMYKCACCQAYSQSVKAATLVSNLASTFFSNLIAGYSFRKTGNPLIQGTKLHGRQKYRGT
jgi:hypothetical protein